MEAGCYNSGNSYICICHDLLPADANNNCDRSKELPLPSSSTDISVTDTLQQVAPTEGSFGSHQLLGMLTTSKRVPSNTSETVSNPYPNYPSGVLLLSRASQPHASQPFVFFE
ncbi:uncharacterized protein TNCT_215631 [Trichonephila clavata]|uniref:Uncharacterized protein n=1 Tax=Trichonephila clavata TaxID=2740835 RepID=A0A8X6LHP7_TRICU|nr:uncharacterized protein TNCT_215631 [Trichonephila clavata]